MRRLRRGIEIANRQIAFDARLSCQPPALIRAHDEIAFAGYIGGAHIAFAPRGKDHAADCIGQFGKIPRHAIRHFRHAIVRVAGCFIHDADRPHARALRTGNAFGHILKHAATIVRNAKPIRRHAEDRAAGFIAFADFIGGQARGEQIQYAQPRKARLEQHPRVRCGDRHFNSALRKQRQIFPGAGLQLHVMRVFILRHRHPFGADFFDRFRKMQIFLRDLRRIGKAQPRYALDIIGRDRMPALFKEFAVDLPPDVQAVQQRSIQIEYRRIEIKKSVHVFSPFSISASAQRNPSTAADNMPPA